MDFYEYLLKTFGYNEVILFQEISFKGYSVPWIKKELRKLCEKGKLQRFEKGVYYIPKDTPLGKSRFDARKVIIRKYMEDSQGVTGYYSGITFLNALGLTTQMPNTLEICTNHEPSRIREVSVGNQKVVLRRARTRINSTNAAVMSFLELMNFTDASFYDEEKRKILSEFIKKNGITRKSITEYSPYFPDKAMRTLVESEIIYDVAQ